MWTKYSPLLIVQYVRYTLCTVYKYVGTTTTTNYYYFYCRCRVQTSDCVYIRDVLFFVFSYVLFCFAHV